MILNNVNSCMKGVNPSLSSMSHRYFIRFFAPSVNVPLEKGIKL